MHHFGDLPLAVHLLLGLPLTSPLSWSLFQTVQEEWADGLATCHWHRLHWAALWRQAAGPPVHSRLWFSCPSQSIWGGHSTGSHEIQPVGNESMKGDGRFARSTGALWREHMSLAVWVQAQQAGTQVLAAFVRGVVHTVPLLLFSSAYWVPWIFRI